MRSSLPATVLSLLPSLVSATIAQSACLQIKSVDLAQKTKCGHLDRSLLRGCLESVPNMDSSSIVEQCLVDAGCTSDESKRETHSLIAWCDSHFGSDLDLKRRGIDPLPQPTPLTQAPDIYLRAATTTASSGEPSPSPCSTETDVEISSCKTDHINECVKTMTKSMVCAQGNMCMTDNSGNNICMYRKDGMTTSGAVVGIFLAVVLAVTVASLFFLCCKDKRDQKRARAKSEAAAIAKANAVSSGPSVRETTRSASQRTAGHGDGSNPFAG
ncbi:adenovirus e3 region CR2 domain protein [Apiospora phragmitis]|uniref:Adenovirus e3 region CR2 domain protein n=1 Tax=Apiospora phragmitis TaxID=2905665 RepID=A0ABR1VG99_9PEZI